ncbi:MAG TPA: HlyD family efflux transporter periplasmic adaptor subunit, partial [Candidatus Binataceae bacterium]|nr:HlyD family efflux transporter periplasmic adaptor subunit [Candidatus Binataceae bacterium]
MSTVAKISALLALVTALAGCGREAVPPEQPQTATGMLVTVAPVQRGTISSEAVFPGVTVALKQLTVRSPASGIVENLNVQPGDRLTRGQTIARVVTREDVAARNGVKIARQLGSGDEKEMAAAVERYASSPGIAVIVPDSATVAKRVASSGQFVNEFDPIAELVDLRSIYVEGSAPLRMMPDIRPGASALVMSPALAKSAPAKVVAILPSSSASQTFGIKIAFVAPESPIIESGAAVTVSVVTMTHPDALLIPTSALFVNAQD